jgi:hypothetical protein
MIWHRCGLKQPSLFGPACCGREATTYDRARKAWLCPEHTKDRLCEFCHRTSVGAVLLYGERRDVRNLALCGLCGADRATVTRSNQFVPVTRPLSLYG